MTAPVFATALEALDFGAVDVFVEYTKPDVAKNNVITAIQHGAHVVIGASGLTSDDLAEIDGEAKRRQRGVLAVGNFALTDSGSSAKPYVDGALLAIRKVAGLIGVHRGLDAVLDL
jgi:Dihydrodipicolinate reductase